MGFNSAFKGLRSVVYQMQWMGLMVICCGMLGVSVRKMKAETENGDSDIDW